MNSIELILHEKQILVEETLRKLKDERVVPRIREGDHTLWKPEPAEITNRLGWLESPEKMIQSLPRLARLSEEIRAEGYTNILLLGMGGSSLAPEVFRKTFAVSEGFPDLAVLDSTDPLAVKSFAERLDPARSLFIVSTKSGTTAETISFFKFFYNLTGSAVGFDEAGQHFIAVTDPGSKLSDLAKKHLFRDVFLNDPNIGGRYSALSFFGLVPAALIGLEPARLLERARASAAGEEGLRLGATMGRLALEGRDKLTLIISPSLAPFGAWIEQLIAESTGKEGKGILPVDAELPGRPEVYGGDRFFVHLRLEGDDTHDAAVRTLAEAGQPVIRITMKNLYDLGGEFFHWEVATGIAGHLLGINPFDQPDVEAAKKLARQMLDAYRKEGCLPSLMPTLVDEEISVFAEEPSRDLKEALALFLDQARPGDYLALQAYVQPTEVTDKALQELRHILRDRLRLATTLGYGPRFLHSTGQLHKGGPNNGLFMQITADDSEDQPIPDEAGLPDSSISFGILKAAQALGDRQALLDADRRVIRLHLGGELREGLARLTAILSRHCQL